MSSACTINKSEEKTHKYWLFSSLCMLVLFPLIVLGFMVTLSKQIDIPESVLYECLIYVILGILSLWLIWYCAYKNPGTRLLTFWLFTSPIKRITQIGQELSESSDVLIIIPLIIESGIFLWWYLLSLKLRKINKARQKDKPVSTKCESQ